MMRPNESTGPAQKAAQSGEFAGWVAKETS